MSFGLESDYVILDGNEFEALKETGTDRYYFAERILVRGILNFGLVKKGESATIVLSVAGIETPVIIDSIVALSDTSTSDEITFALTEKRGDVWIPVGKQRYSNAQMPIDFPDGIIKPNMAIEVSPSKADSTIVVYVKPVRVLFEAQPMQVDS